MKTCVCCGDGRAPGDGKDFCQACWDHIEAHGTCPGCGLVLDRWEDDSGHPVIGHPQRRHLNWREPLCLWTDRSTLATFAAFEDEVWRQGEPTGKELLCLGGLGIAGEAGEVADEIEKHLFHDCPLDREALLKEVGDVLWYAMAVCRALDASMQDAAEIVAAKLRLRFPGGFNPEDSARRVDVQPATGADHA